MAHIIPDVAGAAEDTAFHYQGVNINNLDDAVRDGWLPVKENMKVGTNWSVGANGLRMCGDSVLCRIPMKRKNELDQLDLERQRSMSIGNLLADTEARMTDDKGREHMYGEITEG